MDISLSRSIVCAENSSWELIQISDSLHFDGVRLFCRDYLLLGVAQKRYLRSFDITIPHPLSFPFLSPTNQHQQHAFD